MNKQTPSNLGQFYDKIKTCSLSPQLSMPPFNVALPVLTITLGYHFIMMK